MEYTIDADEEFLRVKVRGRDTDRPPSEMCAAVLAESRKRRRDRILIELDQNFPLSPGNQFINLVARNHGVQVRNFAGLDLAKAWLRGETDALA